MNDRSKKEVLLALALVLAAWGILLFFQSAYFGAFFYGVDPPSWTLWVGALPIWAFNAIDTVMVAIFLITIYLSVRRAGRSRRMGRSGSVAGVALLAIGLVLIAAVLFLMGFTLAGLWSDLRGFLGI